MADTLKVILDTNLWVSYLISNRLVKLDLLIHRQEVRLIFSEELLEEFIEVVGRPKFERYFSRADIEALLRVFEVYGEMVTVESEVSICRDSKDNFLLSLAQDSAADYLLTGDKDLLEIGTFHATQILKIADFFALFDFDEN